MRSNGPIQVSHDPVARVAIMRVVLRPSQRTTCHNCGAIGAKFNYYLLTDGGTRIDDTTPLSSVRRGGPFCSRRCFTEYNER